MSELKAEYHFKKEEQSIQIPIPGEAASRMMNGDGGNLHEIRFIVEGPLPPDLGLAIMTVLSFHISRRNPISRTQLCASLKDFRISDRHIREQIKQLRRSGHLIGSMAGENGGYYLITTPDDLQEFLSREYQAKINDMRQTVEAMTKTASQRWGPDSIQLKFL